jgi:hypothetical protein
MAEYPTIEPTPQQNGKSISNLIEDIEKYLVDNTEGNVSVPEVHNIYKNIIYSIPLSGATNTDINLLQQYDAFMYDGSKWVNSENYTYHSSGTRTEVYSTGETYNRSELYTKSEILSITGLTNYYDNTEVYSTGETYTQTEVDTLISNLDISLSGLTDSTIISPQSGQTYGSSPLNSYSTYDSIFYSGGTWVNKPAYIGEDVVSMLEDIKNDLPDISGETIAEYIRSQFEGDVHVNQSGQTEFPNSDDGVGNLYLWTDGESGMTWQPSILWRGQYSTSPSPEYIDHLKLNFSGKTNGAGDFILSLNTGGTGSEPSDVFIIDENQNNIFGESNLISNSEKSTISGGIDNSITDSDYSIINGGSGNSIT